MFRTPVLLLALLFNAPIIWQALGAQTLPVEEATIRFIITVPVVAILLGMIRIAGARGEVGDMDAHGKGKDTDSGPQS